MHIEIIDRALSNDSEFRESWQCSNVKLRSGKLKNTNIKVVKYIVESLLIFP
jgi:hypothetical protein